MKRAEDRFARGIGAAFGFALLALLVGLWEGIVEHQWAMARPLSVVFAACMVLIAVAMRGSRVASVLLVALCFAASAWYGIRGGIVVYVAYGGAVLLAAVTGVLYTFRLPRLHQELVTTWTPHVVSPGDIYTVRDGTRFAVVKVLGVSPGRVHVRQFGMRYSDRPWHVKSSTLERPSSGVGNSYAHLPLDAAEFARWEPWFMKTEPVAAVELGAMRAWRDLHEEQPTAARDTDVATG